ncbi:MAG: hypothetical protein ACYSSP_12025 [Planctomycetota bacterium]|jgi:hypothetical protein
MDSYWGLFCILGLVYSAGLMIVFLHKGIGQVVWPILLLFCVFYGFELEINPVTGNYILNETLVPMYIFHPMCLLASPIIAVVITICIHIQNRQNGEW